MAAPVVPAVATTVTGCAGPSATDSTSCRRIDTAVHDYIDAVAAGDLSTIPRRFGYPSTGGMIDDIRPYLVAYATGIVDGSIKVATTPTSGGPG